MSHDRGLRHAPFTATFGRQVLSLSPRLTLLLLLSLAAVILGGGLRLARQSESVRVGRERDALRRFSGDVQGQLLRLDELYESHLARLARTVPNDAFTIRREADRIVGVRQFSLLHRDPAHVSGDLHVQVAAKPGERTPVPMFLAPKSASVRALVLVDAEKMFGDSGSGWIDDPGQPLLFWLRRTSDEVAVLMIDTATVEEAISQWLRIWAVPGFKPVRAAGGLDQLRTRQGRPLAASGDSPHGQPDLLLPLRSRLGSWELASWDRREIRVHYDTSTLAASGAVAVLVALLGFIVFGQQRRASVLAAQRVSFVNRVSHELRSPLTNMLLNLDLAAEAMDDAASHASRRLVLVQEEAHRLGRLIDNVLTFSRHEQGQLRSAPRACVPASVIAAVVEQFAPSFARRALTVSRSGGASPACLLDSDALAQILGNLLSNVEKYVPGGEVKIVSTLVGETLIVTVTDEGPGIPVTAAERIFRPFERLGSRVNEGASGTGLGLAIARDLASGMGGSLRLVPSARGASFELRLPAPPVQGIASVA